MHNSQASGWHPETPKKQHLGTDFGNAGAKLLLPPSLHRAGRLVATEANARLRVIVTGCQPWETVWCYEAHAKPRFQSYKVPLQTCTPRLGLRDLSADEASTTTTTNRGSVCHSGNGYAIS